MNKLVGIFGFFSVVILPASLAHAGKETDIENRSGPVVRVIKTYPGEWRGWSDGCVNCGKPLAPDRVLKKKKRAKIKARATAASNGQNQRQEDESKKDKPLPQSLRRGYCECRCNPPDRNQQKVFGGKQQRGQYNERQGREEKKADSKTKPVNSKELEATSDATTEKKLVDKKSHEEGQGHAQETSPDTSNGINTGAGETNKKDESGEDGETKTPQSVEPLHPSDGTPEHQGKESSTVRRIFSLWG